MQAFDFSGSYRNSGFSEKKKKKKKKKNVQDFILEIRLKLI